METLFALIRMFLCMLTLLASTVARAAEPADVSSPPGVSETTTNIVSTTNATRTATSKKNAAKLSVHGYGLFGNRELKRMLHFLEKPGEIPEFFDANYIEDAVLILFSRLNKDGYLAPQIRADAFLDTGEKRTFTWKHSLEEPLPRPLRVKKLEFHIEHGVLFYFEAIDFAGLRSFTDQEARHFFEETDPLIPLKKHRIYNDQILRSGLRNVEEALERQGFQSAAATSTNLVIRTNTGAVTVSVLVNEGPKSMVRSVRTEVYEPDNKVPTSTNSYKTNVVFNQLWQQDLAQDLKRKYYKNGFADTAVQITQENRQVLEDMIYLDVLAKVNLGRQFDVGQIRFEGNKETHESMMRRRVKLHSGDLLDPTKAEDGRYRLARMGIFDAVELRYDKVDEDTRDVVYRLREGKQLEFSLLAGYGSYEQLRGGVDLEQNNLWGMGHHSHLRLVQSMKSSSGDYLYTIPQFYGDESDFFFNANALRREEIDFTREEFAGGAGVRRFFKPISSDVSVRYNYQVLNAASINDSRFAQGIGLQQADVGSFILDLKHDKQDNPLTPRKGYKVFTTLELASEYLAGDVNYQRFQSSASYHQPIGEGRWMHFGVTHGFITTDRGPDKDLPFNKRFFPGGDSSIRGYQFGEASPKNPEGKIVGAESFGLLNVEFEQALTRSLSIVFFVDSLGYAQSIRNYPFDHGLFSAGGGFSFKTLIGPARLEYGYNLNPRDQDPVGTLQFSIGFPF
jgi:outer membrane protein insertion porin family